LSGLRDHGDRAIRLLVPRHLPGATSLHHEAFVEQLTAPLPADVVDEMRWYLRACRDGGVDLDERYYRAQTAVAGPRVRALYLYSDEQLYALALYSSKPCTVGRNWFRSPRWFFPNCPVALWSLVYRGFRWCVGGNARSLARSSL
jgi:hypothetical protein